MQVIPHAKILTDKGWPFAYEGGKWLSVLMSELMYQWVSNKVDDWVIERAAVLVCGWESSSSLQ